MNILIANTQEFNPEIGGVERVSVILAQEFQSLGHYVFFLAGRNSIYSEKYDPIVPQIILKDSSVFNSNSNIEEFANFLEEKRINIIINQAGNVKDFSSLCFKSVEKYKKAKLLTVIHIDPAYRFKALFDLSYSVLPSKKTFKNIIRLLFVPYRFFKIYFNEKKLYNYIYDNSDLVVLLSNKFIKDFKNLTYRKSYNKLIAIFNPFPFELNVERFEYVKEKKIIYVGRLDYAHKRTDRILEIWTKLSLDYPNWTLDIIGDGPIKNELIEYVNLNKIERVNFIGFVNPIEYYKKAQIVCMTSTYEGLPMVLIEASNYGSIPIAFKSFSSLSDIIDDNINGFMIKPFSLLEYEKKLRLIMDNDILRQKMQIETKEIPIKFQKSFVVKQWTNIFDEFVIEINAAKNY
jgi:glycosyltransferase involved in cell wall biosynthesis